MRIYRLVSLFILFIFILPINISVSVNNNDSPIHIIGNDDFTPGNGVSGGNGTENDPYIIENLTIDGTGLLGSGIFIQDTTAYFIIRNCTITNFFSPSEYCYGIRFINVENGRIENTTTNNNHVGIFFKESKLIVVSNVISSGIDEYSAFGIGLWLSENITIEYSDIYAKADGIHITKCSYITVKHSSIHDNSHYGIFSTGKYDSKRIIIENCSLYNNEYKCIHFVDDYTHKSYSLIKDCEIYNNGRSFWGYGIEILRLSHNIIENCTIYGNIGGIFLDTSNNVIRNCSIFNHTDDTDYYCPGIALGGWIRFLLLSWDNSIINCDIYNNEFGVILVSLFRIRIEKNNIHNNTFYGISSNRYTYGTVANNNFADNGLYHTQYYYGSVASLQSYLDFRNNWWNNKEGPSLYLVLGPPMGKVKIPFGNTDGESLAFMRGIALTRPWLTEPFPDAGRQT
jgi:parallel beta-helix repeat protein